MTSPKKYQNISLDPAYFPAIKKAKLQYQILEGRDATWGEFFQFLISQVFPESESEALYAEMHQHDGEQPLTEEELAELGWMQDDAIAANMVSMVSEMTGVPHHVDLSDASCELIAEKLYQRLKS